MFQQLFLESVLRIGLCTYLFWLDYDLLKLHVIWRGWTFLKHLKLEIAYLMVAAMLAAVCSLTIRSLLVTKLMSTILTFLYHICIGKINELELELSLYTLPVYYYRSTIPVYYYRSTIPVYYYRSTIPVYYYRSTIPVYYYRSTIPVYYYRFTIPVYYYRSTIRSIIRSPLNRRAYSYANPFPIPSVSFVTLFCTIVLIII